MVSYNSRKHTILFLVQITAKLWNKYLTIRFQVKRNITAMVHKSIQFHINKNISMY